MLFWYLLVLYVSVYVKPPEFSQNGLSNFSSSCSCKIIEDNHQYKQFFPSQLISKFDTYQAIPNWNRLYHSVALLLYGSEELCWFLKLVSVYMMATNLSQFVKCILCQYLGDQHFLSMISDRNIHGNTREEWL